MSFLGIVGALLVILTPIVIVHELGHYIACRLCHIRVEEFGLGLPPRAARLFTFQGTLFSLNWVPIGGFVRPAGENDTAVTNGLAGARWPARLFVLSAGVIANFLFAFLLLWVAFLQGPTASQVVTVLPNSPAQNAGLQQGDVLISINGEIISSPAILVNHVWGDDEKTHTLIYQRGDEKYEVVITAVRTIGVEVDRTIARGYLRRSPIEAAIAANGFLEQLIRNTFYAPVQLAQGELDAGDVRPVGIVGLGQIAGRAAENASITGSLFPLLLMAGLISGALGLTQLLPLPALDGGRIFFVLIEAVSGKRVKAKWETAVHRYGIYFFLILMIVLIFQDLLNPIF
ncbi:MAG: PDZ domain-containing protein [Chloroflexi bacterium]|nr:PDZ domain-containing protein [Chloroflexota bacterium]